MITRTATPRDLMDTIRAHRFTYPDETRLQDALAEVLTADGFTVHREVRLSATDRIDLLVDGIGIEVKVAGSLSAVLRQLLRYAASEQVQVLLLVTRVVRHRALPVMAGGKPLFVVPLTGGLTL